MWETRTEENNFAQKHDVSLAKDKIRPSVVEEIRNQARTIELPSDLHSLQVFSLATSDAMFRAVAGVHLPFFFHPEEANPHTRTDFYTPALNKKN